MPVINLFNIDRSKLISFKDPDEMNEFLLTHMRDNIKDHIESLKQSERTWKNKQTQFKKEFKETYKNKEKQDIYDWLKLDTNYKGLEWWIRRQLVEDM